MRLVTIVASGLNYRGHAREVGQSRTGRSSSPRAAQERQGEGRVRSDLGAGVSVRDVFERDGIL